MENNNLNQSELDFEKMNATLANPEFANWYYNEMYGKNENNSISMTDFVQMVKQYSEQNINDNSLK